MSQRDACSKIYKQFFISVAVYAYPIWRLAASAGVRKQHVLQPKRLLIASDTPWYVNNKLIREFLEAKTFFYDVRPLRVLLSGSCCEQPLS